VTEKPQKLWQAVQRWYRFHPIVLMFAASKAVRAKGPVDWIDNSERTNLAKHCESFATAEEAWAALPLSERRDLLKTASLSGSLASATWDEVALAFGALVERDRVGERGPEPLDAVMSVPDELLAWGEEREIEWARPWASDARTIMQSAPALDVDTTNRLLNHLDALVMEAVKAKRADLLAGFDTLTARLLNIMFEFDSVHGRISLGRAGSWSYEEIEAVLETGDRKGALGAAAKAKALLGETFPAARIGAITEGEGEKCSICGNPLGTTSVKFESGSNACHSCWTYVTSPMPEHLRAMAAATSTESRPKKSKTASLPLAPTGS